LTDFEAHGLDRVQWPQLTAEMARRADTPAGKARVAATRPDPHPEWLAEQQRLFAAASRVAALADLSLAGAIDLDPVAERAAKGATLTPETLVQVAVTIDRGKALKAALRDAEDAELLAHLGRFEPPDGLKLRIYTAITESGEVRDQASSALAAIRQNLRRLEAEIDQLLQTLIRSKNWADYLQEPLVTTRRGRRVVPVKRPFAHQLGGLVHDQSGSGQTVFVEPAPVVERQNRIAELTASEADEVDRILRELSHEVSRAADPLQAMNRSILTADVLLAKMRWARDRRAALPHLGGERLELVDARHPLLAAPVPLSLNVGGPKRALVITGPNTGGKTVALKTTGLLVGLALSGWPIPASPESRIPRYRTLYADIGDEQSLEQSLSTFSGHVRQLVPMVADAGPGVLALLDEIGAGTDPEEGAALALALVDHFVKSGATAVVTTHYARVKLLAYRDDRVENARMDFDRERLEPTYRLVMGQPGSSQALYIARRLGLDAGVVDAAEAAMDEEGLRVDRAIGELERVEQELTDARAALAAAEQALRAREARLAEAEDAARRREANDRHRLQSEVRRRMAALEQRAQEAIAAASARTREEREAAVRQLRLEMREWHQLQREVAPGPRGSRSAESVAVGQWVEGDLLTEPGTVVALDAAKALATVEANGVRVVLPLASLAPARNPKPAPARGHRAMAAVVGAPTVGLECDLRGMTVLDAVDEVESYLDRAFRASLPFARLIHGKGTGSLRRAVQEHLVGHPHVASFRLGQAGEGGDGVTVVELRTNR
jgi:DNA mismatch repair protein MutS2